MICELCDSQVARARLRRNAGPGVAVCAGCLAAETASWRRRTGFDAAGFFLALAPSRDAQPGAAVSLPADTRCPGCALTFAEFSAIGLAGCPTCYSVFASAILPALRSLAVGEPPRTRG